MGDSESPEFQHGTDDAMTITYRMTFRDRVAFAAYALPRKPVLVIVMVAVLILFNFQFVVPAIQQSPRPHPWFVNVITFIIFQGIFVTVLITVVSGLTLLTMISKKNKTVYCERSLTVGADGFFVESEYGRSETRWTMVQKLARTRSHIFLYLNSDAAVVVPRRAFADDGVWNSFYEICRTGTGR
ncbi:MAG: YcxB family protein [Limisphaerales bacterium]